MVTNLREPLLVCLPSVNGNCKHLDTLLSGITQIVSHSENAHFLGNPSSKLIFTGNYFGHGNQGLETWDYIKSLKHMYRDQVSLLVGNEEINAILQRRVISMAFPPEDSAKEDLLAETLQGKTLEKWFQEDTSYGREYGYDSFVRSFSSESFEKALEEYHQSTASDGELNAWIDLLYPFEVTIFNGKKILISHGDIFPHNLDVAHMKKAMIKFENARQTLTTDHDNGPMRSLLKDEYLTHTFAKRSHGTREETIKFTKELGVDYVVTNICGSPGIYHNHSRIIRLGTGFAFEEPRALVFSGKGVCEVTASGKIKRVYSN